MQRNLVIYPTAASSIEITEIDLGSALFAYNNVFIALLRVRAGVHLHHAIYSSTENATDKKLIKIIT